MSAKPSRILPLLLTCAAAACASTDIPEPVTVLGVAADSAATEPTEAVAVAEPVMSLEERWEAPFAVSSVGRVQPAAERDILVLGADSALAESLARRADDRATRRSEARRGGNADGGNRTVTIVLDREANRRTAPEPERRAEAERTVTTHRVERGETWLGIARRYGMTYSQLQRANPGVQPDRLRTGQVLRVESAEVSTGGRERITHRVEPGESLFQIARLYEVSVSRLREANGLNSDRITPNQVLVIPRSSDRD